MRVEDHEKDNYTTYLDDGIRVHRIKIGIRYVSSIFDSNGMLCAANGFNTEAEREDWVKTQLVRNPDLIQPNLENPESKSEISRKDEESPDEHPLLGF